MAMHAGITGSMSGTVFNVAGTRKGVHVIPPGLSSGSSNLISCGAVMLSTPSVALPLEVRFSTIDNSYVLTNGLSIGYDSGSVNI